MVTRLSFHRYVVMVGCAVLGAGGIGCSSSMTGGDSTNTAKTFLQLKTLSNRADLISGGDALVEITLPPNTTPDQLHVAVGARDVSAEFAKRSDGRIIGLISGLDEGANRVAADLAGEHGGSLTITNHKIGGPVISGTQVKPFICATPIAQPQQGDTPASNASGLSTEAIDDQCNIATEIKLYYRTTTAVARMRSPIPAHRPRRRPRRASNHMIRQPRRRPTSR